MTFRKGRSGNPGGRPKERPFRAALDMEIKAAGEDHKELRLIARALLDEAKGGNLTAINAVADRLDGKPIQESGVTIENAKHDATDWTLAELLAVIEESQDGDDTPISELTATELMERTAATLACVEERTASSIIPVMDKEPSERERANNYNGETQRAPLKGSQSHKSGKA